MVRAPLSAPPLLLNRAADPERPQRRRPPLRAGLLAGLAALMLHGVFLSGSPRELGTQAAEVSAPKFIRVRAAAPDLPWRQSTDAPPPQAPAHADHVPAPTRPVPARRGSMPVRGAKEVQSNGAEVEPAAVPLQESVKPVESPEPAASTLAPAVAASMLAMPAAEPATYAVGGDTPHHSPPQGESGTGGEAIPVYPTAFAPSQTLTYHLRRGLLSGTGVLSWHHDPPNEAGASYELRLEAKALGLSLLTQVSQGHFDAAGLAPQRFTDQRLRSSTRAANFQRERGLIGFSGPSVEFQMVPGVQDRLSWMLQLPAILEAGPQRAAPGERVTLYVIGARGDAAVWSFRYQGHESVTTEAGELPAVKFIREPRQPNDTQAEVWLDPAHHHLPVRARLGNPPDGEVLDLVLSNP